MQFLPSYENYRKIVRDILDSGIYCDYEEAIGRDRFLIMRHDVEFSMERAYQLSLVESEMNFNSTYFVQITNNTYNALSGKSIDMMHDMARRGHYIGLHYHCNGQTDATSVRDGVRDQLRIMSEMLGMKINRYSFHRPKKEIYYYNIYIEGMINAYSPEFFSYAEDVSEEAKLDVKYIADSKHRWNYGYPNAAAFQKFDKMQILIHPFSWSEKGYDNLNNFKTLIEEKQETLIDTLDDEFMRFREVREEIRKAFNRRKSS